MHMWVLMTGHGRVLLEEKETQETKNRSFLLQFCATNGLCIMNTFFGTWRLQVHLVQRFSWIRHFLGPSHLNMDPRNAQFISIFQGWKLFQPNLKSKLLQPFSVVTLLLKHLLFLQPGLLLQPRRMYLLPAHHHKNVVYQFVCPCNSQYREPTSQRLQKCIKQHALRFIRNHLSSQDHSNLSCACKKNNTSQVTTHDSAIKQHLLKNPPCASQYSDIKFSIIAQGHTSFHLSALEATFIKSFQPNLCQHKEFLYRLKLFTVLYSLMLFYFHF